MTSYLANAAAAFTVGFLPFLEIYLAVPAAIALGLDYVSAVIWSSLGNFLPAPIILLAHERLRRIPRVETWLEARRSARLRRLVDRYGNWFVLLVTPLIGSWAVAVTGVALSLDKRQLIIYSAVSIAVYATLIAAAIAFGIDLGRAPDAH